jgi:hypothetical protein
MEYDQEKDFNAEARRSGEEPGPTAKKQFEMICITNHRLLVVAWFLSVCLSPLLRASALKSPFLISPNPL